MSDSSSIDWDQTVRVLSDLHLGHPSSKIERVEQLRPLIEGVDTVIFNGDTCEQFHPPWRTRSEVMLGDLRSLCLETGVRAVFMPGNHDPDLGEEAWLDRGALHLSHGDLLFEHVSPWGRVHLKQRRQIEVYLETRCRPGPDLDYCLESTRAVSRIAYRVLERSGKSPAHGLISAFWPPRRFFHILHAWVTMVAAATDYLERYRPEAKVYLFGHMHRAGIWERKGRILCNTGAFTSGADALAIDVRGEQVLVREVIRAGGAFHPSPSGRRTFVLPSGL